MPGRCASQRRDLDHGAFEITALVNGDVGVLIVGHVVDLDASGAAPHNKDSGVLHGPLPAHIGVDALQGLRDPAVDVPEQECRQIPASELALLSGRPLLLTAVGAVGPPCGTEQGDYHPQAPQGKGEEQEDGLHRPAQQRQNGDDHTD